MGYMHSVGLFKDNFITNESRKWVSEGKGRNVRGGDIKEARVNLPTNFNWKLNHSAQLLIVAVQQPLYKTRPCTCAVDSSKFL